MNKQHSKHYNRVHYWLRIKYGMLKVCEGANCKGFSRIYDWALKKGKRHAKNRENYLRLCRSCHLIYDWTPKKTRAILSHLHTPEVRKIVAKKQTGRPLQKHVIEILKIIRCKEVLKIKDGIIIEKFKSLLDAAEKNNVSISAISQAARKGYRSNGFHWEFSKTYGKN